MKESTFWSNLSPVFSCLRNMHKSVFAPVVFALTSATLVSSASVANAQTEDADDNEETETNENLLDKVAAVVNDEIILYSDLMARYVPISQNLNRIADSRERQRQKARLKADLLSELVNEELVIQAAGDSHISVESREIQAAIDDIKKQNNLDDNQLAEALRGQGMSMARYRKDLKRQIIRMRTINIIVRPKVKVSDEDVKARYVEMNKDSDLLSRVKLQHILIAIPPDSDETVIAAAQEKAKMILAKVKKNEPFAELASEFSDDPSTKADSGDLGWIERGTMSAEWEDAIFNMKKGESKGPIKGPNGLHVFKVTEVEKSTKKTFESSKAEIQSKLQQARMEKQTKNWLENLREKAHVDIKQDL